MSLSDWIKKILGILGKEQARQDRVDNLSKVVKRSIAEAGALKNRMTLDGDDRWIIGNHDEFSL